MLAINGEGPSKQQKNKMKAFSFVFCNMQDKISCYGNKMGHGTLLQHHGYVFHVFFDYQATEYVRVFLIHSSLLHIHKPGNTYEDYLIYLLNNF